MTNKVKMTIYVPKELYKHYKILAAHYDKTLSQSVEDAMLADIKPVSLDALRYIEESKIGATKI